MDDPGGEALLVDPDGRIVFYNDAAAEVVGSPFDEIGILSREEWNTRYGPSGSGQHLVRSGPGTVLRSAT